jgi:hypothetical protein
MQQTLIVVLAFIALTSAWSLVRAARTRRISSRGWTFHRDESPVGFWAIAIIDFGILVASLGLALHALGLIGDLPTSVTLPGYH